MLKFRHEWQDTTHMDASVLLFYPIDKTCLCFIQWNHSHSQTYKALNALSRWLILALCIKCWKFRLIEICDKSPAVIMWTKNKKCHVMRAVMGKKKHLKVGNGKIAAPNTLQHNNKIKFDYWDQQSSEYIKILI